MNLEEFKQVDGFPDYLVSEYGVVWDTRQNKELKWIKNNGFCCVNIFEQYNLVRQLQLEKLMYLMNQYHTSLKEKYPATPEIDRRVLDKLAVLVS